ncbi:MAG: hypothetical protein KGJ86_07650, partial [Chloroflexota bacterium]|nr:hypothetical protein [Chloroflexota bacterium]
MTAVLIWWLAIELLGLAAAPWGYQLLRGLPDRGYGFAKILGLLILGYVTWLLEIVQLVDFGRATVLFFLVVFLL